MSAVLDSSAIVALIFGEPGSEQVEAALSEGAIISAVNVAEVVTVCLRAGYPPDLLGKTIASLPTATIAADHALALQAGEMTSVTKSAGLSLGDRFCLALAVREGLPALTTDRAWAKIAVPLGIVINVIR